MFGAILGDMIGCPYEFNNIKTKDFPLFTEKSQFTDDSVMTLALADALMDLEDFSDESIRSAVIQSYRFWGSQYPDAGYGCGFSRWLETDDPKPYNSYGNGSAMRVSAVGWMFNDLDSVRHVAKLSADVTHNHPEGIKGAESVAAAIYLARTGHSKEEIKQYVEQEFGYDLSRSCDEIRPTYYFNETCQYTVPEAFAAFLEGYSFEDVLRLAVSLGGDSDTLAAIAGSMAEAYYGLNEDWKRGALCRLPDNLALILRRFDLRYGRFDEFVLDPVHEAIAFAEKAHRGQKGKGTDTDYIVHPMEVLQILTSMNASQELQIAGLLHDTVEDADVTLEEIAHRFGGRVAELVGSHTEDKTKSWRERKQHTIDELMHADRDTKMLIMADKVSNLRRMLSDYAVVGEELWNRFNAPKQDQAWYNSEVQDALYEMQFDNDTRMVYWEMVALFKDLFVTYYMDPNEHRIYQLCPGISCSAYYPEDNAWESFEDELPTNLVHIPRQRAERLEEYWSVVLHDSVLDAAAPLQNAIDRYLDDMTTEKLTDVLDALAQLVRTDGHLIIPADNTTRIAEDGTEQSGYLIKSIDREDGTVSAVAFTNHAALRCAPKSSLLALFADDPLQMVCSGTLFSGLTINPWTDDLYLPRELLEAVLEQAAPSANQ